jgi:hypothetical protein
VGLLKNQVAFGVVKGYVAIIPRDGTGQTTGPNLQSLPTFDNLRRAWGPILIGTCKGVLRRIEDGAANHPDWLELDTQEVRGENHYVQSGFLKLCDQFLTALHV